MFLQPTLVPYYSAAKGSNVDLLDPQAVSQNFNTIQVDSISADAELARKLGDVNGRLAKLEDDIKTLDHFMKFCAEQRPEAIQAYMTMLRTQDRLGVAPVKK